MENSVTVIIVNWNGGSLLEECLLHLTRQTLPPTRILVMDNGSSDGSAERAAGIPGVTLRRLGYNAGFAVANNRALEECDTEWVALLNPDAFAENDWLESLLAGTQAQPQAAAFGSRQMVRGASKMLDGIGDVYHISGLVWRRGHGRMQSEADLIATEIFSPCAAAALYKRAALVEIGGFDEDFFCYVEDVDVGFRLRLAGYSCQYVPEAVVHHVGSYTSGGKHSDFSTYHGHRNLVWTFTKNMPGYLFWALLPMHVLFIFFSVAYIAFRGQGWLTLRAYRDAIGGIPSVWRKRQSIQARRKASIGDIWRVLDKRLLLSRS